MRLLGMHHGNEGPLPSFPALYQEYSGLIRNVLYRLCGRSHLDDLTQETFVKVWKGLSQFEGKSSLKTWIYTVATRVAIDHIRANGDRLETELDENDHPGIGDRESDHARRDLVRQGLQSISFDHRTVLVLHVMEGLSIGEIAQFTETPEGTVKSRLHYAREAMAEFLKRQGVDV